MDKFLNNNGAKKLFRYLFNYINTRFKQGVTSIDLNKSFGITATFNGVSSFLSVSDIVYNGSLISLYKTKTDIGYEICFTYSESEVLGVYPSKTKNTGTNKTLTTLDFDPFGNIFYYDSNANTNEDVYGLYTQYRFDIRYSFNISSLVTNKEVYIKCSPQVNGRVKLDSNQPITLLLPVTEDGFVYILLGHAVSTTNILLIANHPIYYYKDGALRLWTNPATVNISGKEDSSNKVTSLSSFSTDTQYPSAKCIYDLNSLKLDKDYIVTSAQGSTVDKTENDIITAISQGKSVFLSFSGVKYPITSVPGYGSGNLTYGLGNTKITQNGTNISWSHNRILNGTITINGDTITPLTQHLDISGKANKISIVNHGTSDTTFELTSNTYHKWGTVSTLTLTLGTPTDATILNEYMFSFTSGATPTTLSLPAAVLWAVELDVEANKTYQVSIIDNLATYLTADMIVANGDVNAPEYATKTYVDGKLALKEDVANKVTSIDENSTDTQYPSAKLVYDSLNT